MRLWVGVGARRVEGVGDPRVYRVKADLLAGFEEALEGPRAGYMHVAAHHLVRVGHSGRHHLRKCADAHLCPTTTPRYARGLTCKLMSARCALGLPAAAGRMHSSQLGTPSGNLPLL